ncbi:MAG: hypothetical protein JRM73_04825 [Nitrososphaerota archaeon]|nr:hypothetical protein [Nitrososphaerota archaeon]
MVVTLSLGSAVVAAATAEFGVASSSDSLGASLSQASAGTQLSLVYSEVAPAGACPTYHGTQEGYALALAVFDYGSASFAPSGLVVNSTVYPGPLPTDAPGSMVVYGVTLSVCSHSSGLTVLAYDPAGAEVQFET